MPADAYKKAVILGAAGFIGVNLARTLDERDFKVVCFDKMISPHWPKRSIPLTGDFTHLPDVLMPHLDGALVFHLVSCTRPAIDTERAVDEIDHDVKATVKYLESTKGRAVRWIFISSGGTIYGQNGGNPIPETYPTNPICSYGITKLTIERYFALYRLLHSTDYVITRLSNPYGPWQHPLQGQGVIPAMLYRALRKEHIEIWGDGSVIRDYIYIRDAIDGILSAALKGEGGEVYNVSTANGLSVNQLISIIEEELKTTLTINHTPGRPVDVKKNVLNSDKLFAKAGWRSATPISRGVGLTAKWLRENFTI